MPNADNSDYTRPRCSICGVSFPTKLDKEQHLRLHCVLCEALLESRSVLIDHMKDSHQIEGDAVFWPPAVVKANSADEDDGEWSEDELDRMESQIPCFGSFALNAQMRNTMYLVDAVDFQVFDF